MAGETGIADGYFADGYSGEKMTEPIGRRASRAWRSCIPVGHAVPGPADADLIRWLEPPGRPIVADMGADRSCDLASAWSPPSRYRAACPRRRCAVSRCPAASWTVTRFRRIADHARQGSAEGLSPRLGDGVGGSRPRDRHAMVQPACDRAGERVTGTASRADLRDAAGSDGPPPGSCHSLVSRGRRVGAYQRAAGAVLVLGDTRGTTALGLRHRQHGVIGGQEAAFLAAGAAAEVVPLCGGRRRRRGGQRGHRPDMTRLASCVRRDDVPVMPRRESQGAARAWIAVTGLA
jgi:hypothetical protein